MYTFQKIFLNRNISVNTKRKLIKIGALVVATHSEGTVSQIFLLGLCYYSMKCRKLSCKKCQKFPDL